MAQRRINLAVIFIITCCGLQSVHSDFNVTETVTYFIGLTDFRRPILVEQTRIISDDCSASCDDPKIEEKLGKNIDPIAYPGLNSKCNGWLDKCVDFSGWKGAPAEGEYCSSKKHLTWAKDANLTEYGYHFNKCDDAELKSVPAVNVIGGHNCHTCLCVCTEGSEDAESNHNWAFSLQPEVADVENNMVVVGVRFREENKIIRMEIKEGEFESRREGAWKPANKTKNLVPNVDYSPLMPKSRSIQLEKIIMPENYTITGVRFVKKPTNLNGQEWVLRMEVRGTKIDKENRKVLQNTSTWYSFDDMDTSSSNYKKSRFELSRKEKLARGGYSQPIIFETSDIKRDLGADVKPTIDMKDYEFGFNSPFNGIELNYVNDMFTGEIDYLVPNIFSDVIHAGVVDVPKPETTTIEIPSTTSIEIPSTTPGLGTALKAPAHYIHVILLMIIGLFSYGI